MSVRSFLVNPSSDLRKPPEISTFNSPRQFYHLEGAPFRVKLDQEEVTGIDSPRAPALRSSERPRTSMFRSSKPTSRVVLRDQGSRESQRLPEFLLGHSFETTAKEANSVKSRGRPLMSPRSDFLTHQEEFLMKEIIPELCVKPNVTVLSFQGPTLQVKDSGFPNRSGNPHCGNAKSLLGSKQTALYRPHTANESHSRLHATKSSPRTLKMQLFANPCVQIQKTIMDFQDYARHSARCFIGSR